MYLLIVTKSTGSTTCVPFFITSSVGGSWRASSAFNAPESQEWTHQSQCGSDFPLSCFIGRYYWSTKSDQKEKGHRFQWVSGEPSPSDLGSEFSALIAPICKNGRDKVNMAPICIVLASLAATINDLVIIKRRRANFDFVFRKSLPRRILARYLARSLPEIAKMDTTKSKWPRLRCSCFIGSYYRCINND